MSARDGDHRARGIDARTDCQVVDRALEPETWIGPESSPLVPPKMRTFSKSTPPAGWSCSNGDRRQDAANDENSVQQV